VATSAAQLERMRLWRQRNPDYYRELNGHNPGRQMKRKHGITVEDKIRMLEAQGGRCYLCGDELPFEGAHVDHDHRCCPANRSCQYCRRGLAHSDCNLIAGNAADDPDKLERIAANLRTILPIVDQRLAAKCASELTLFSEAKV
jgi:Recombination endonuclease VII